MATQSALDEYEADRLEFIEDIKEDGFESSFGVKVSSAYSEVCIEKYFPTKSKTFNDVIESGQSVYIVTNEHNLIGTCDFMGSLGRFIKEKKPFPEGLAKPIYYEILVND